MYRAVPTKVDLPAMEREILELWREREVFARSLEATADGEPWIFYEGPPTANGTPGTHHVEARVFKDVFPRYRTMKGYHVPRKAGWDCHGLPVELAVEKELGFSGKKDIEAFGVAGVQRLLPRVRPPPRRRVRRDDERMATVDMDDAMTMAPS
jgi:isoleucyl-tRNA synthetase